MSLIENKIVNVILLITILGEFIIPWILKHFYKEYNSKTMVMSVLGCPESPVRRIYNAQLVWLGFFLMLISVLIYNKDSLVSKPLAILTFVSIGLFAIGAGVLSGIFSVNESKDKRTFASEVHGAGSAIGFMALLFFPLLQSVVSFKATDIIKGVICAIAFVLALVSFVFFVMGDKEKFKKTVFSYEGVWERLSLFFMYIPFLYMAVENLFIV